jgi:hypothetical protein
MSKKPPRQLQIVVSADLERKLILWAAVRDTKLNDWIKMVLRMRADETWAKIQQILEEKAKRLGMSVEELEQKILEQNGFDFEREREELESGLLEDDHESRS